MKYPLLLLFLALSLAGCATDGQTYEFKSPSLSFPVGRAGTGYVYGGVGFKGNSTDSLAK